MSILGGVSVLAIVLLLAAIVLVAAVHGQKLTVRVPRPRARARTNLRVVEAEPDDEFRRAVERDLAALPTIDERDAKKRR